MPSHRRVDVAGHEVHWDPARKLYYCDLTVEPGTTTYAPFVRLALARYQPHALVDAKLSRVVLADFAQLTPERALTVTANPYVPGVVELTLSGPAPQGPVPQRLGHPLASGPTEVTVTVQRKDPALDSDLAWSAAAEFVVRRAAADPNDPPPPDFIVWSGTVSAAAGVSMATGEYRLLVEEHEVHQVDGPHRGSPYTAGIDLPPGPSIGRRLVYAETMPLDDALLAPPPPGASSTTV